MAKTDELMKNLFKHKDIFADLFNATIFNGQQLIKPEKLTEINTENIHIEQPVQNIDNADSNITKRYRDLCMRQDDSILQIILGCEDQSEVDYSMPIRTMLYDSLKYTEQQNNLELRKRKDGTYYHSKLRKNEKVLPVLTIVFYYGDKEWDAGKCIHDLIKWPKDLDIKSIIPDYKMNLLWAYNVKDINKFKSDLQYILYMLKYKEEENNLEKYIVENNENLQHMHQDSHNAAAILLNHKLPELINSKKGDLLMGKNAIQAIYDRGENNGIEKGDTLHKIFQITKKIQKGKTLSTIADEIEAEENDILPIYTLIKNHPNKSKEEIYKLLQEQ